MNTVLPPLDFKKITWAEIHTLYLFEFLPIAGFMYWIDKNLFTGNLELFYGYLLGSIVQLIFLELKVMSFKMTNVMKYSPLLISLVSFLVNGSILFFMMYFLKKKLEPIGFLVAFLSMIIFLVIVSIYSGYKKK